MARFAGAESDNLEAIYQFFLRVPAQTPEADKIQREFLDWYATTKKGTWFYVSESEVANALAYRNRFNRANAATPAAKKKVEEVIATGVTSGSYQRDPAVDEAWKRELAGTGTMPGWAKTLVGVGVGIGIAALALMGFKVSKLIPR